MAFEEIEKFVVDKQLTKNEDDASRVAGQLKYLQYSISATLAPYLIKLESSLKKVTQNKTWDPETTLKACVNIIAKSPSDYLDKSEVGKEKRISDSHDITTDDLAKVLELYRVARNKVMHDSEIWLIEQVSSADFKDTFKNEKLNLTYEDIRSVFNRNYWVGPSAPGFDEKSFLQILLTTIYLFNSEKVARKVLAEVDYEIYRFSKRWGVITKNLYNALGLREDWIKKMM